MNVQVLLRTAAVAMALVGAIDPSWTVQREMPRPIDVHVTRNTSAAPVVAQLARLLGTEATFDGLAPAVARVAIGDAIRTPAGPIPTSFVSLDAGSSPNVRVVSISDPQLGLVGWRTRVSAVVEGRGVAGSTSSIVLEQGGVEMARVPHAWTKGDEQAAISIPFVAPLEGAARVTLRVLPLPVESSVNDNVAHVRVMSRTRKMRVLVHEPRPSWAAAFVRRALEANAAFDVSAFAGASKGLAVQTGDAPGRLGRQIENFDVVAVGAPDELSAAEVETLSIFARRRGGSIVLLPDRRPSGSYLTLLQAREFEELLVEKPMIAKESDGGVLRATELAVPRGDGSFADVFAFVDHRGTRTPIVFGTPLGAGRVIFSGALDAWRFRALGEEDFSRFWTSLFAGAALSAPDRIAVSLVPGIAQPGEDVAIRVRLRGSELDQSTPVLRVPPVRARLISSTGSQEMIRLWPADDPGSFEGRVSAPAAGTYQVEVSSGDAEANTVMLVADDARQPSDSVDRQTAIAAATGGVMVGADDLAPVVQAVRELPASHVGRDVHPARSPWFVIAFGSLLCAEWTLRRRAGLR